ncbi:uncharacterized protein LOC111087168 [Limulus polyphemus]|uniref:Uncharacterized protein LOC111087168 n=1 Tax=Limulus polyphemus TaxID=6850 RepID=A0ABM1SY71_LIMPO|nr:uncharacterized protein LOC111087168 [Limulus polyphemus]
MVMIIRILYFSIIALLFMDVGVSYPLYDDYVFPEIPKESSSRDVYSLLKDYEDTLPAVNHPEKYPLYDISLRDPYSLLLHPAFHDWIQHLSASQWAALLRELNMEDYFDDYEYPDEYSYTWDPALYPINNYIPQNTDYEYKDNIEKPKLFTDLLRNYVYSSKNIRRPIEDEVDVIHKKNSKNSISQKAVISSTEDNSQTSTESYRPDTELTTEVPDDATMMSHVIAITNQLQTFPVEGQKEYPMLRPASESRKTRNDWSSSLEEQLSQYKMHNDIQNQEKERNEENMNSDDFLTRQLDSLRSRDD